MRRLAASAAWSLLAWSAVCWLAVAGCGRSAPEGDPPTAQRDIVDMLRADLTAERHPADGGGSARLERGEPVAAGERGRWEFVYQAGERGIAEGGWLFLQVSPFWGWSTPQVESPAVPGYTEVSTEAEGVELEAVTADQQLLGIRIAGRALEPGETVRVVYGASPAGAVADRYAEERSPFYFAVDGDGDGVRALLEDSPVVEVRARAASRLVLTLPSTARPGERARLTIAVLDPAGNSGVEIAGEVTLETALEGPRTVTIAAGDRGLATVEMTVPAAGRYRVRGAGPDGVRGESNPLVAGDGPRLLWGDLHGHSGISDGTGTPEAYFRYARDAAALDVVALTDHDHWGMRPLARTPELWREIREATEAFHDPGRFVTLLGYEWTNWVHGHRHVLYFEDEGDVLSSLDPRYETPDLLWAALAGRPALTFAHHSAGGPVATDWRYPPDPVLEPVSEVSSVHGSSEAMDSPGRIYSPVPGNFVRDLLDRGHRLGFVGSGDSHDGHPGLAALVTGQGGLAAIWAEQATREAVLEAMRARRVYATNGPRIVLRTELAGEPMGATLAAGGRSGGGGDGRGGELSVAITGTATIERVELVRSGEIVEARRGDGRDAAELGFEIERTRRGDYLYVRVTQEDGGVAWSSPYYFE